jgi:hypothetical protein
MMQAIDPKWTEWNSLGIIPGPEETEEEYLKRTEYSLSLKQQLASELGKEIPFSAEPFAAENHLQQAYRETQEFYDIAPRWVPVFYTNYQLSPWQGGCAWIFQVTEDSPKAALIQLRRGFREAKKYLKIYDREELLSHEFSHAGRLAYQEPKFEEFFAYKSSSSAFRKYFGPIVKSSFESLLFVIVLLMVLILDISAIALANEDVYSIVLYSKLIPIGIVLAALVRLVRRHRQLDKCSKKLSWLVQPGKVNGFLYRLTDLEIIAFSRMNASEIKTYISEQQIKSVRWKVIAAAYL